MPVFDNFATGYSFWIDRVNPPNYQQLLAEILPDRIDWALDVGCGPGALSFYLADYARQVVGLDLSAGMLRVACQRQVDRQRTNIRFILADLYSLPLAPASIDFIGSDCVLHDTDVELALPMLIPLLKPGGRLVIRDLVTHKPVQATSPAWQVSRTVKQIPRYLRRSGVLDTLKLLSFELSPAWVRHKCEGANLTPQKFRTIFSQHLPGCRFIDFGWSMAALWQAPA